jgi:hypothetical protein
MAEEQSEREKNNGTGKGVEPAGIGALSISTRAKSSKDYFSQEKRDWKK